TAGDPISCPDTDETCATQDITKPADLDPLDANYDQTGTDTDPPLDTTQPLTAETDPACEPDTGRVGPWVCAVSDPPADGEAAYGPDYLCNLKFHCYSRPTSSHADWHGTINYGTTSLFGGYHKIGTIYARVEWVSNGPWVESEMFYTVVGTDHTRDVRFNAEIFNGAPNAPHGGSPIRRTKDHSPTYSFVPSYHEITWDYWEYDDDMWDHNIVDEFKWSAPGYFGYFYFYVRSPTAHTYRLGGNARYFFNDPLAGGLPQDQHGGGHRW
ncbi:MAG: hypothetical protein QOE23_4042, partial [Pseudonocardiales bacterium]|nr:hypothetical protein [Pseudonocardiales bacterium]